MDWITEIYIALQPLINEGIPVMYGWYDENINKTHVTYCEITDMSGNHADDEEESHDTVIQVDIWSNSDNLALKKRIKKLMKTLDGACYTSGNSDIETDKKPPLYHDSLRFNLFIEED